MEIASRTQRRWRDIETCERELFRSADCIVLSPSLYSSNISRMDRLVCQQEWVTKVMSWYARSIKLSDQLECLDERLAFNEYEWRDKHLYLHWHTHTRRENTDASIHWVSGECMQKFARREISLKTGNGERERKEAINDQMSTERTSSCRVQSIKLPDPKIFNRTYQDLLHRDWRWTADSMDVSERACWPWTPRLT